MIGQGPFGIGQAVRGRVVDDTHDGEQGKHGLDDGDQLVADFSEVNLDPEQVKNQGNDQQRRRDESQLEFFVREADFPVNHFPFASLSFTGPDKGPFFN